MIEKKYLKKISYLDWGIVISSILLLISVYIPQIIWEEEDKFRKEGRHRMSAIANAQEFYLEMTGNYTDNGEHLFELVEAAMDSLIADSLFTGEQSIILNNIKYKVKMERGLETKIDTTFSFPTELYVNYDDTVYTIGMKNPESGNIDTLFINVKDINKYKSDFLFQAIYNIDIVSRTELRTDYLRKKYHLENNLLFCPLTNDPFVFEIDSIGGEEVFTVRSPLNLLDEPYKESRFGIFTFEAGDHGFIRATQKSWAE